MTMTARLCLPLLLVSGSLVSGGVTAASASRPPLFHEFAALAVSPNGSRIASVEGDLPADPALDPVDTILLRAADGQGASTAIRLPCGGSDCIPSSPAWAPDGKRLAFVLRMPKQPHRFIYAVNADGTGMTRLLEFDGALQELRYGPDGTLAVLATAGAHKEPGATQAAASLSGEIGVSEDEQRIAVVADNTLRFQSPADLYVYEYDWRPDPARPGHQRFVGTAARGNGDNNWWVARLFRIENGRADLLYAPPQRQQLADPAVSPDGSTVSFIGGIMSDFGSTGGDVFRLSLDAPHGAAPVLQNLAPNIRGSVTALGWNCGTGGLVGTTLAGAKAELLAFGGADAGRVLWSGDEMISDHRSGLSLACGGGTIGAIRQSFTEAPEVEAATLPTGTASRSGVQWHVLTHANGRQTVAARARSIDWRDDQFSVQGWLLSPKTASDDPAGPKGPMIVSVHGGPSAANMPEFLTPRSEALFLLQAGYRVFLPNPRGSFGQGEAFTEANVRDFGHGDLRDILSGIDAVERVAPVDDHRLGLTGYSYGGYMTMWTVTQTNRFKAAVAGAGISDWQSYYGQNGIDQWMIPFFGASVYDDPAIYAKSSPIGFIRQVRTPTFEFVGDADVECPMPQTEEFYHALHTLGVPTEFVVYPGQGHGMRDPKHWLDAQRRTIAWFGRYLNGS